MNKRVEILNGGLGGVGIGDKGMRHGGRIILILYLSLNLYLHLIFISWPKALEAQEGSTQLVKAKKSG